MCLSFNIKGRSLLSSTTGFACYVCTVNVYMLDGSVVIIMNFLKFFYRQLHVLDILLRNFIFENQSENPRCIDPMVTKKKLIIIVVALENISEYQYSLTHIFPYKNRQKIRENTSQRKAVFWHILRSDSNLKTQFMKGDPEVEFNDSKKKYLTEIPSDQL